MTEQELDELLSIGHELRGVEFKGPGPRSAKQLMAKIARAVLGMANRRDGGLIVLGVDEQSGVLNPVGLSDSDLATWRYDDVSASLATYADPSVSFTLEVVGRQGANYVVLLVDEFDDVPVLCKKPYQDVLRGGACYVRSHHKPETSEIPSQEDMRDLLDLATEKRLRKFLAQAQAAGLAIPNSATSASERFDEELGDFR